MLNKFNIEYDFFESPIGTLYVVADNYIVKRIIISSDNWFLYTQSIGETIRNNKTCEEAITQIKEYFAGNRHEFTVKFSIEGPNFSQKVWRRIETIPYGQTCSYSDIAKDIGSLKSYRAVGQAARKNPLPILIPCHRIVGKSGKLTGFMGRDGIAIKEFLLELENNAGKI